MYLFFSEIDPDRGPCQRKTLPEPVFNEPPVRLPDILRVVTEEGKDRISSGQLSNILDLYVFALD